MAKPKAKPKRSTDNFFLDRNDFIDKIVKVDFEDIEGQFIGFNSTSASKIHPIFDGATYESIFFLKEMDGNTPSLHRDTNFDHLKLCKDISNAADLEELRRSNSIGLDKGSFSSIPSESSNSNIFNDEDLKYVSYATAVVTIKLPSDAPCFEARDSVKVKLRSTVPNQKIPYYKGYPDFEDYKIDGKKVSILPHPKDLEGIFFMDIFCPSMRKCIRFQY